MIKPQSALLIRVSAPEIPHIIKKQAYPWDDLFGPQVRAAELLGGWTARGVENSSLNLPTQVTVSCHFWTRFVLCIMDWRSWEQMLTDAGVPVPLCASLSMFP
jgi:hypothetical protein